MDVTTHNQGEVDYSNREDVLPPEELAAVDIEVFRRSEYLTNSEMNLLLNSHLAIKREKHPTYQPPAVIQRTLDYVGKFHGVKNEEAMKEIRRILLYQNNFKQFEAGLITNLMPQTAEEAMTLVPSLKDTERFPTEADLQIVLDEIAQYNEFDIGMHGRI